MDSAGHHYDASTTRPTLPPRGTSASMETPAEESTRRMREIAADMDRVLPLGGMADLGGEDATSQTPLDTAEEQRLGLADARQAVPQERFAVLGRPALRRDGSVPAPSQPPPPAPAPPPDNGEGSVGNATDSLSLMQLRRLVTEMPRVEPTPYAFVYRDAASLPEELEEWFAYSVEERARILKAQSSFAAEWGSHNNWVFTGDEEGALDWMKTAPEKRRDFMKKLLAGLDDPDLDKRLRQLEALVYLVLGCWHETAGLQYKTPSRDNPAMFRGRSWGKGKERAADADARHEQSLECPLSPEEERQKSVDRLYSRSTLQLEWIKRNILMLFDVKGLQTIFDVVRNACLREW
jgi:hypothetical protein